MSPTTTDADSPLARLRDAVEQAAGALAPAGSGARSRPTLERPKKAEFGDFSTNAAMLLAPVVKAAPRDVAGRLGEELRSRLGPGLERVEVAGPGFLNLFLAEAWYAEALEHVLAAGEDFGRGRAEPSERVNVEFVSANPTGPMHVGHARLAAYGDALARLLAHRGHDVTREFYVNDAGTQIVKLGQSIRARARGEEIPEDGYRGDYVADLAAALPDARDADPVELGRTAVGLMVERMEATLEQFRTPFDVWFYESALHEGDPTPVQHAFDELEQRGHTYRHEGALWLRTTAFGDDKDRVLVRSSGEHTYFASDIAYLLSKLERGFERVQYVLGADHHGYIARLKGVAEAFGRDPDGVEVLIMRFVQLVSRGERASMSKRAGEFVTLDDLVAEIGVDAARWFLLQRSHDTGIELDVDLAAQQNRENPVYYVQYAHARIASLQAKGGEAAVPDELPRVALHARERALIHRLLAFPGEVAEAADRRAPHRLTTYALELAQDFTMFYEACPILKDDVPDDVRTFRLGLAAASRRTLASALGLLGVHAPESM
jgi:arginyl-tRNA synthetase